VDRANHRGHRHPEAVRIELRRGDIHDLDPAAAAIEAH